MQFLNSRDFLMTVHECFFLEVFILSLSGMLSLTDAACTLKSGCVVETKGTILDFCDVFNSGPLSWSDSNNEVTYTYNAKEEVVCDPNFSGMSVCQTFSSGITVGLGLIGNSLCVDVDSNDQSDAFVFKLEYRGGEVSRQSEVFVHFRTDVSKAEFSFLRTDNTLYTFQLYHPYNNGVEPGLGGIISIVVCVIAMVSLLVAVLAYIVIGLLVNRFYKGARGLEMIPHLSFWKDFPYLLKDGVVFTFTGWPCCKNCKSSSPSRSSYEKF